MKALVSILIPAYNADEWVVDHGPTDGTLAVARQFESNEVRVVTQPNQGAVAARVPLAGDTANHVRVDANAVVGKYREGGNMLLKFHVCGTESQR